MKKSLIIATFALGAIVFGTNTVKAQNHTATTAVNIILNDVISIDNGSVANGGVVDFNYITAEDYNNPKNVTVENSLIITSTKNFHVKVKAGGANFTDGTNDIPVNVLQLKTAGGSMGTFFSQAALTLSDQDQTLVGNAKLGAEKSLTIDYSISKDNAQNVLLGKPAGTYTQKVTYTATAI